MSHTPTCNAEHSHKYFIVKTLGTDDGMYHLYSVQDDAKENLIHYSRTLCETQSVHTQSRIWNSMRLQN